MLIGTLLPAGAFASENGEVSASSAISVSEEESNMSSPEIAEKPVKEQTAEPGKAVSQIADEKTGSPDEPEKTVLSESGRKEIQDDAGQSSDTGSEPGTDNSEKPKAEKGQDENDPEAEVASVPESEQSEAESAGQNQEGTQSDAEKPAAELKDEKPEEAEETPEKEYPAFSQSCTVGAVKVAVDADAGVFPEKATLSVTKIPSVQVESMIEEERTANVNVASSYTFDIKILDSEGSEVQPKKGQEVRVSFSLAEVADPNLDTQVYHISGGDAETLEVTTAGQTATAETTGFSLYTVEFTYNDLQYVLQGGQSVALSEILEAVGLFGDPSAAVSSDPDLFDVEKKDGVLTVISRRAFQSEELLKVTINGTEYKIKVTDDGSDGSTGYGLINDIPASEGGYVWMGGDSPVKWHVIGKNNSNWLLISSDLIGGSSNYMNWNDAKNYCGTVFDGFSGIEQAAVPVTSKSEPDDYRYESNYGYYFGPSSVNANMFLLSSEEAETYFGSDAARQPGWWWLRSPIYDDADFVGAVNGDGEVNYRYVNIGGFFGARPAFRLNLSSVLFSSAAEGGKSSTGEGLGSFGTIKGPSGDNEVKLTLIDERSSSARKDFSANVNGADSAAVAPGGDLTISYSGAAGGDHISALLCDSDGTILYYASTEQNSDGTWTVTLPNSLSGSHILKVFSEQQNGDKKTDYASPVSEIALNVTTLYTVTFVDEDGTTVLKDAKEYPAGTAADDIEKPADPTKEATAQYTYTFAGWDPAVAEVTGDVTYKATYSSTVNEYTIKFVDEDGTELQSGKVAYGETPSYTGETPTKAATAQYSYTFAGWDPEIISVTGDATYTATPVPAKKGILTFDLGGGTLDGKTGKFTIEANIGDVIAIPAAPSREGYTFKYWKGSEYYPGDKYTVEGDHTFTAEWEQSEAKTYKVTFNANGHGTAPATQAVEEGKKAAKPADPTASGYTFGGWYTDKDCKSSYSFDTAVTKDITLYAKWTAKSSSTGSSTGISTSGGTAVKTGDESNIGLWFMLMAASLLALVFIVSRRRFGNR